MSVSMFMGFLRGGDMRCTFSASFNQEDVVCCVSIREYEHTHLVFLHPQLCILSSQNYRSIWQRTKDIFLNTVLEKEIQVFFRSGSNIFKRFRFKQMTGILLKLILTSSDNLPLHYVLVTHRTQMLWFGTALQKKHSTNNQGVYLHSFLIQGYLNPSQGH